EPDVPDIVRIGSGHFIDGALGLAGRWADNRRLRPCSDGEQNERQYREQAVHRDGSFGSEHGVGDPVAVAVSVAARSTGSICGRSRHGPWLAIRKTPSVSSRTTGVAAATSRSPDTPVATAAT